jgi:hypothetical protein
LKSNILQGIKYSWFDVPLMTTTDGEMMSAQAYVRAILVSGGQLLFCSHHAKSYAEGLKPVAAVIQDETQKLAKQSAN